MAAASTDSSQVRTFQLEVFRNGNWIDIPVSSVRGTVRKSSAGQMRAILADQKDAPYTSRLYEGEKVRAHRGIVGAPQVRSWTGFVDAPTANDKVGISRDVTITDNIKELYDSILIEGVVYDTWTANAACVDAINKAIATQQFKPTDDNGNALVSTANYNLSNGNSICYFPDLINADGSMYTLASGSVGSFTSGIFPVASLSVPLASGGATWTAFELPQRYLIASTMTMFGLTLASGNAPLPPASGNVVIDYYNGIMFFNAADGGKIASFSGKYYDSPNWSWGPGSKIGDIVNEIMDKSGFRWSVDGFGKLFARYVDSTKAPKRVLNSSEYIDLQTQTNRDRRNVILCEGWDGNCGRLFTSKCVMYDDINNPPPKGLGKRQYVVINDRTWKTQAACNNAAYYAAQQIGRRGKIFAADIIDDPNLLLDDVIAFDGVMPEVSTGDFFYIESIDWQFAPQAGGGLTARAAITGTGIPGRGTIYLGPASNVTTLGGLDYSQDVQPIKPNAALSPAGGLVSSIFSKAGGLSLNYTPNVNGTEVIDLYGSDNSHLGPYVTVRASSVTPISVALPAASMTAGLFYVIKMRFMDASGNMGIYRDFILCTP